MNKKAPGWDDKTVSVQTSLIWHRQAGPARHTGQYRLLLKQTGIWYCMASGELSKTIAFVSKPGLIGTDA